MDGILFASIVSFFALVVTWLVVPSREPAVIEEAHKLPVAA